jgi:phosphate transport system permease protein
MANNVALFAVLFFSLLLSLGGSLSTPAIAARRGYNPNLGMLVGGVTGFAGTWLVAMLLWLLFSGIIGVIGGLIGGLIGLVALSLVPDRSESRASLPDGQALHRNVTARHLQGKLMRSLFLVSVTLALIALATLIWTIVNKTVGYTAVQYALQPEDLTINGQPTGRSLDDLSENDLVLVLAEGVRIARLRVLVLQDVREATQEEFAGLSQKPIEEVLRGRHYPDELADLPFNQIDANQAAQILEANLLKSDLKQIVLDEIVQPQIVKGWSLWESLTDKSGIERAAQEKFPQARLEWHSWLNWDFISSPLDPRRPDATGLRPALYGSLMIIVITILVAFPVGVGAAIYLEEYAGDGRLNRLIQTNISNLAGVPSIIYGMLGLGIFVRALSDLTSGNVLGTTTANGRTIASAAFTLALLILPLIIINAQEAMRAVPSSLRQASYGLGATQWQTIWYHVLPYSLPGILTGTILAISRAVGETAPLILIGAATYLTQDPTGPFSNFTALPMVIYRWTTYPQAEFGNAAAAAIVVLLVLLLSLNSIAILLRNRFSRRLS